MKKLNHLCGFAGFGAIGVLVLVGCGMGGSSSSDESSQKTSICMEDASDKTSLDSAPKTDWKNSLNGLKVPSSKEFGPEKVGDDKVPSCFQHSPEGALFAATNYSLPVIAQDYGVMSKIIREQALDNDARNQVAKKFEDQNSSASASSEAGDFQVAGFRIENYAEDKATVKILVSIYGGAGYGELTFTVQWDNDDWRFDADADTEDISFRQVQGPDGYTEWGPDEQGGSSGPQGS
ncbi:MULTISPECIES: hypothetical protein [Micrococcaceae]|uniref:hypothetical protein n=1 Tax=unclassified Kocuria TaxID=2649579 RepID=UPI001012E383|nr:MULTISPECIES: hypothetical protein [unclassified Kocuria]